MSYQFETERLLLRKIKEGEELILRPLLQQEELMSWFGGALTESQVTYWLAENIRRYEQDGYSYLVVYTSC